MRYLFFNSNNKFTNIVYRNKEIPEPLVGCIQDDTSNVNITYHNSGIAVLKIVQISSIDTLDLIPLQECTIINLPDPCLIDIAQEGVYYVETVIGGTSQYQFDTPGVVKLTVNALHHLPKEFIINVN